MKSCFLLISLSSALALCSCATTPSPEARIDSRPEFYNALSSKERALVRDGKIEEGMSKDAVFLAWGRAHEVKESSRDGKRTTTWVYYGSAPAAVRTFSVGYGYGGYGRCAPGYHLGQGGWDYGPNRITSFGTDYYSESYVRAKVEFQNDKVVFWERNDRRR